MFLVTLSFIHFIQCQVQISPATKVSFCPSMNGTETLNYVHAHCIVYCVCYFDYYFFYICILGVFLE